MRKRDSLKKCVHETKERSELARIVLARGRPVLFCSCLLWSKMPLYEATQDLFFFSSIESIPQWCETFFHILTDGERWGCNQWNGQYFLVWGRLVISRFLAAHKNCLYSIGLPSSAHPYRGNTVGSSDTDEAKYDFPPVLSKKIHIMT